MNSRDDDHQSLALSIDYFLEATEKSTDSAPSDTLGSGGGVQSDDAIREEFVLLQSTLRQRNTADEARDRRFSQILLLSLVFLVIVAVMTSILVSKAMDPSLTLGANAAVFLGYLGLIHAFLKHERLILLQQRNLAIEDALIKILTTLPNESYSVDQVIQLVRTVRAASPKPN